MMNSRKYKTVKERNFMLPRPDNQKLTQIKMNKPD